MQIKNTEKTYGLVTILLHWLSALSVFSMFALGFWMVGLDYMDQWVKTAPHIHKSVGVIFVVVIFARFAWRMSHVRPASLPKYKPWENITSKIVHYVLYLLMVLMFPTGYLITTAKGQSLHVFNWFSIPSVVENISNLEDVAGEVHWLIACSIIGLVVVHSLGALKHHFYDKDVTLKRMFGLE